MMTISTPRGQRLRRCRYRGDHRLRRRAAPGQSRLDELTSTAKIALKSIVPTMMANGFNGIFLVATNPCDIITWQVWQLSGLPRSQVLGTGVWLDTTPPASPAGAGTGDWRPEHRRLYPRRAWRYPVSGVVALPRYMARQSPTSTSSAPACRSIARRWLTKCASWD